MHRNKKKTTEEFVEESRKVHGDKYDYSKVEYKNNHTKVCIICPVHGEFWQIPADHLKGCGCESCSGVKKLTLDEFIKKAQSIHNDKYDYSNVVYVNSKTKVSIICKKCRNEFLITPNEHLSGRGCRFCGIKKRNENKIGKARFSTRGVVFGVGINDYNGSTTKLLSYSKWVNMLTRCYDKEYHSNKPTYKDCWVCDEWLFFSNFKEWFDNYYIEGYVLDKDILVKGNKVYSPNTCCFIPAALNSLLTKRDNFRGIYPIGVKKTRSGKFMASVNINEIKIRKGGFNTPEEAFDFYKDVKEEHIKDVAQKYFNDGLITEKVYNALINYKVEITD